MSRGLLPGLLLTLTTFAPAFGASPEIDWLLTCPGPAQERIETREGMFRTHLSCGRLLAEIPRPLLNRDLLLNIEFVALSTGVDSLAPGVAVDNRVVRFERRHGKVYLLTQSHAVRATPEVQRALEAAQLPAVLMTFDILSERPDGGPVIDLAPLFVGDVPAGIGLAFKKQFGMHAIDARRSYIDRVKAFPNNVRIYYYQTWTADSHQLMEALVPGEPSIETSAGFMFAANLLLLPDPPMRPRYWDARVGYFAREFREYGSAPPGGVTRGFIERYRLRKKYPAAEVSEPQTPIVFYVGREVPDVWRPYLKRAVEDWQPLFEQAGFRLAIVARDAPSESENPAWDPDDVRYNVIRWAPGGRQNALGASTVDPRSGEVLSSHTLLWQDVLKLLETWYFVQVSPLDPRARKLPLPTDLVGELLRYMTHHEIGHALGLRHNFKAASMITTRELRDPDFTRKWGTAASVMSYARFNYVAQPGDDAGLMPKDGPYDYFAIDWGYRDFGDEVTLEDEIVLLDRMAARQVGEPWLRFGGEDEAAAVDPTVTVNALAGDAIESAELGLRNIDRVMRLLVPATSELGADYERLREVYEALILQRNRELVPVARRVGGVVETRYHAGRGGRPFVPVAAAEQRRAVRFLIERAFATPAHLLDPEVLARIAPADGSLPLQGSNLELLRSLVDPGVFERMIDVAAPDGAYLPGDLLADLNDGLFRELDAEHPRVDSYRRELQRNYVSVLLAPDAPAPAPAPERATVREPSAEQAVRAGLTSELAGLGRERRGTRGPPGEYYTAARAAAVLLADKFSRALPKVDEPATRAHLVALEVQLRAWVASSAVPVASPQAPQQSRSGYVRPRP